MKGLSLFANIGIGELTLPKKFQISHANEIDHKRCNIYKKLHPKAKIIVGDISSQKIIEEITSEKFDFIISTPPCQGMSTAGKMDKMDPRNHLVKYSIDVIKKVNPKFIFHENVPGQERTFISFKGKKIKISDFIKKSLSKNYNIISSNINMSEFGIPQMRKRSIFLMTRKDLNFKWDFPNKTSSIKTFKDILFDIPSVDPFINEKEINEENFFVNFNKKLKNAIEFSEFHLPLSHPLRQVIVMQNTPSSKSAFENKKYKPLKIDGSLVKGFKNTYKRMDWNKPAPTITTYNRTISSQENVHPGRKIKYNGETIYSDARALTLYEIMKIMTIPENIPLSSSDNTPLLRSLIGEGVPPLFLQKCFEQII